MTLEKILYIHGKNGNAHEFDKYEKFLNRKIIGIDYQQDYRPQFAKEIIFNKYLEIKNTCPNSEKFEIIANSIGAYFSMLAFENEQENFSRAFFISPIVDMERIILHMMSRAGVSEKDLKAKGEIQIDFGEVLSWQYLQFVRAHPLKWNVPTNIIYGSEDFLTPLEIIKTFAKNHNFSLTVMDGGEHWFHTTEQMNFLTEWLREKII